MLNQTQQLEINVMQIWRIIDVINTTATALNIANNCSDAESVSGRSSTLEDIIDKSSQSSVWHALSTFVTRNLG
ncbi:Small ribosomal subunit protein bS20c [Trichinella spiralis]|uniref:Small ribosomal subunit protein bS20c n=1 Tax=Trichinella spiralis TaxID=6334 RepID=A0ABR3KZS9_TRISP